MSQASQQQYQLQLQQKQAQHESFISRFQPSASPSGSTISGQLLSNTVANAVNAVAIACKQQQQQSGGISLLDNTIGYKSPKYLAELKILKERQAKVPPSQTHPVQAQISNASLPQQVVVNPPQVVSGTVVVPVVVDTSQPPLVQVYHLFSLSLLKMLCLGKNFKLQRMSTCTNL